MGKTNGIPNYKFSETLPKGCWMKLHKKMKEREREYMLLELRIKAGMGTEAELKHTIL